MALQQAALRARRFLGACARTALKLCARLAGQPNSFTTSGTPLKRDAVTLGAAVSAQLGKRLTGFIDVSAEERGSGQSAYALGAGLRYIW